MNLHLLPRKIQTLKLPLLLPFCQHAGATTAQVTPLELTNKMMNAAIEKGAKLIFGAVEGIDISEGKVTGVRVTGKQPNSKK